MRLLVLMAEALKIEVWDFSVVRWCGVGFVGYGLDWLDLSLWRRDIKGSPSFVGPSASFRGILPLRMAPWPGLASVRNYHSMLGVYRG